MKPQLLLVAASGLAREALAAVAAADSHVVIGVLDDDRRRWGEQIEHTSVLGGLDSVADYPDAEVVLCAGKGSTRAAIAARLNLPTHRYGRVVHPSVSVPKSCCVGAGSILLAGTVLTSTVAVRRHVVAMPNVVLTHDDVVGDFATLCASVTLGGGVHVGDRAYIGMSASVRENLAIGDDATIGMGSVVLRDVPQGETWFGSPATRRLAAPTAGSSEAPAHGAFESASDKGERHA